MNRLSTIVVLASVMFSAIGCVVRTRPEHAHRHRHHEHREVVVVHHY